MLKIDQYAYINRLAGVHPGEKVLLAGATMLLCLGLADPLLSVLVIALMTLVTVGVARIPLGFFLKLLAAPLSFLVLGVLTVAFAPVGGGEPLLWGFRLGRSLVGVTAAGLEQAGELLLRSLGAVSCLYFLSLTTPLTEILAVLRRLHLPPLLLELMSLIYRYIFVLLETTDKIYTAQATRWGYASLKTSYTSLGQLISSLFSKSLYNSRQLYLTLTSRCYTGELRVLEETHPLSWRNLLGIAVVEVLLLLTGLGRWHVLRLFAGGAGP